MCAVCPSRVTGLLPWRVSHTVAVSPRVPVTIRRPSRENATDQICSDWRNVNRSFPLRGSQILTTPSSLPLAIHWPSGEKAIGLTSAKCSLKLKEGRPVAACQILTVLSQLAVASHRPSEEAATEHPWFA